MILRARVHRLVLAFCGGDRFGRHESVRSTTSIPPGHQPRTCLRARISYSYSTKRYSVQRYSYSLVAENRENDFASMFRFAASSVDRCRADSSTSTGLRPEYEYDKSFTVPKARKLSAVGESPRLDTVSSVLSPGGAAARSGRIRCRPYGALLVG
jgi:hypothetical protein